MAVLKDTLCANWFHSFIAKKCSENSETNAPLFMSLSTAINFSKIIQKSRKEEVTILFPVWDRWNHNKYLVQMTNPVIAVSYNKLWWPSGKDTWLSHRQSGFKSRWDLFEEKFFLCLCFTKNLIPKSRNLYLSTPMDDFSWKYVIFWVFACPPPWYVSLLCKESCNYSTVMLTQVNFRFRKYFKEKQRLRSSTEKFCLHFTRY